jgi:hypothetical protein
MSNFLSALLDFGQPVSTMQVAKLMEMSWKKIMDNLEALFKLRMVERGKVGTNKRIFLREGHETLEKINFESEEFKKKGKSLKIKER